MDRKVDALPDPDKSSVEFRAIKATQPIGDIYLGSVPFDVITRIAYFDVRRVIQEDRDMERYLGIQRPLDQNRVRKLEDYVNYVDASFPTAIIIAVDEEYAHFDTDEGRLYLRNFREGETSPSIALRNVARVIDGQHRIAGLLAYKGDRFDVPVTVFVGADVSDQAQIFSTVNLEQTKVHKNLVYDLYSLARSRSPQKTCHNIAVALDRDPESPFYKRIKRLGGGTIGRVFEPISQATFVESLLRYITSDPRRDRDDILRGRPLKRADGNEIWKLPFRNRFIDEKDIEIAEAVNSFFVAVRERWTDAWADETPGGLMLNRTNGFRALMRLYGWLYSEQGLPSAGLNTQWLRKHLAEVPLEDEDFNTENFVPGSSGESALFKVLVGQSDLT